MQKSQCKMQNDGLAAGKVPHDVLKGVLRGFEQRRSDVVVGPGLGLDAAVVRMTGDLVAVTSDPITLAGDLMAYYCVHVNANDLAVMGAKPAFMTVVCLLPIGSEVSVLKRLGRDLARYAKAVNVAVVGGHSEITSAVTSPVMVGTMLGRLAGRPMGAGGARPGQVVVMTKWAGLEATAIMARERPGRLRSAGFSERELGRAQRLLFRPGISIVREAEAAMAAGCSAMHDATEGGVATGLWELAEASGVRLAIDVDRIPILPATRRACALWGIDPLGVISSGALLVTVGARKAKGLLAALGRRGISATIIGQVVKGRPAVTDVKTHRRLEPVQDEIVKVYDTSRRRSGDG